VDDRQSIWKQKRASGQIPKELKIDGSEIEILKVGDDLILRSPKRDLGRAYDALRSMPKDFFRGCRRQPKLQERKYL
jgi:virulence-associated protein VagC